MHYFAFLFFFFFFSSRRRHTRLQGDWSSDVCSSDLVHRSTFGAYRRNSRGAVAASLVTTTIASSASRTPTRASRTWPSASAWKVKLSCDGRSACGFAHAGGLAPENAMTCRGCARVTSERTCRSCQVLVPELGSLVCLRWPVFGYVLCVPAGPQATITPSAVLLTDATWYGVPCQTPTTSMSLGIPGM